MENARVNYLRTAIFEHIQMLHTHIGLFDEVQMNELFFIHKHAECGKIRTAKARFNKLVCRYPDNEELQQIRQIYFV